jgi:hypothetical protein
MEIKGMKNKREYKNLINVKCENPECGKDFSKYIGEYNRSIKLGRKQYCCLSCYGKSDGKNAFKNLPEDVIKKNQKNFSGIYKHLVPHDNRRDMYTRFRFFTRRISIRNVDKGIIEKTDITLDYLILLWEDQKGICPFTGWELTLPECIDGWATKEKNLLEQV